VEIVFISLLSASVILAVIFLGRRAVSRKHKDIRPYTNGKSSFVALDPETAPTNKYVRRMSRTREIPDSDFVIGHLALSAAIDDATQPVNGVAYSYSNSTQCDAPAQAESFDGAYGSGGFSSDGGFDSGSGNSSCD
jgi:hypothetical protein